MVYHMKTTLNLDDTVLDRLRREAARQGRTMSELLEAALRLFFQLQDEPRDGEALPELPTFASGGARVEVADRGALYEVMEGR